MESEQSDLQVREDLQQVSTDATSIISHAWKSVRKHFPNSRISRNSDSDTDSIILNPMLNIDLSIEFSFYNSSKTRHAKESPNVSVHVESGTLSEIFVSEFEKILVMKCTNLTEWQTLGDEIEKILQCVEVSKKEKGVKKKKDGRKKVVSKANKSKHFEDGNVSQVDPMPELHFDSSTFCKEEEKMQRPNYFIAVRIRDKDVIKNVSKLQSFLVDQEDLLTKGVIPSDSLHLTLCNLGLDSADDLLRAMEAMNRMKPQLRSVLPKTPFVVHGVSQFYNRAIYAKVKLSDEFLTFRSVLRSNLDDAEIEFREDHESYTPHVTLIKVRRPERRAFGTRNIQSSLYSSYDNFTFGEQNLDAIYLCAMGGQKRDDGFYVTACELDFTSGGDQL